MSKVGTGEAKRLAVLAHIGLSDDEVTRLAQELNQIVEFVEQLQGVDTSGVAPTDQVTGLVDIWRRDVVAPSPVSPTELLQNAPMTHDGYIKVRRVLQ